jgi:rod shape-determining protein MreD
VAERQGFGYLVILLTFLAAAVLSVVPLPSWLQWARPEWMTLTLIYWCIALPHRAGIGTGLLAGIGLDVLEGSVLGQHALALVIVALLALLLYQRLRVYSLWQQAGVVFIMVGISQLICQWIQNVEGAGAVPPLFLLPAISSARCS